jgi:cytochrome oxidase Cu insertion factor (SCO1/SenC/PrrC family)
MKPIRVLLTLAVGWFVLTLGLSAATTDSLIAQASRKPAPGFSLTSADGSPINLADYRGKVVLLDFWDLVWRVQARNPLVYGVR